jgi:NADH-quinone oxidoreductase subunit C
MAAPISASVSAIQAKFKVLKKVEFRGETTLYVERTEIKDLARFCKDTLGFAQLIDLSGVDNFGEEPRFEVVYELYHFDQGVHLRLKIAVSEDELEVPTVSDIWSTADWHEREAYDMYGIKFAGHPDLAASSCGKATRFYPAAQGFPARRPPQRNARRRLSKAAPLAGGPFVTCPFHGDDEGSRTAGTRSPLAGSWKIGNAGHPEAFPKQALLAALGSPVEWQTGALALQSSHERNRRHCFLLLKLALMSGYASPRASWPPSRSLSQARKTSFAPPYDYQHHPCHRGFRFRQSRRLFTAESWGFRKMFAYRPDTNKRDPCYIGVARGWLHLQSFKPERAGMTDAFPLGRRRGFCFTSRWLREVRSFNYHRPIKLGNRQTGMY